MPLARNRTGIKKRLDQKEGPEKEFRVFRRKFKTMNEENRIMGDLGISDCIIASKEGKFCMLNADTILGNMRVDCLLIEANTVRDFDSRYDLVEIHHAKAEKDYQRALREHEEYVVKYEKLRKEHESRMAAEEAANEALIEQEMGSIIPDNQESDSDSDNQESNPTDSNDQEPNTIEADDQTAFESKRPLVDPLAEEEPSLSVGDVPFEKMKKPVAPVPPPPLGDMANVNLFKEINADCVDPLYYGRNHDIRATGKSISKYVKVAFLKNVTTFQCSLNGTKFVIPDARVYRVITPPGFPSKWYFIAGSLMTKRDAIKGIDPNYEVQDVMAEHVAMMERIRRENSSRIIEEELETEIPPLVDDEEIKKLAEELTSLE